MNGFLKRFLKFVSNLILFGGPVLAALMLFGGLIGAYGDFGLLGQAGVGVGMALYLLFWSLLIGGVLRLLLSIDDRLERLEGIR